MTPFFADTDMQRVVEHQAKYISSVMGGPASYTDAMLRDAHAHLHIDDEAFDEMIGLFRLTLKDFAIADADVETIIADSECAPAADRPSAHEKLIDPPASTVIARPRSCGTGP